jgi:hypothetical protein
VLVEAPRELLDDQHGLDYLVWELRGNRICVAARDVPGEPPAGFSTVVEVTLDGGAVVPEGVLRNASGPAGAGPCPLIANSARAEPGAAGG